MAHVQTLKCDLIVIGAGMAGMAATLFATNRGLSVAQVGSTMELGFASGLFDLLGVHPISEGKIWDNPWAGLKSLRERIPRHPYAMVSDDEIRTAFDELLDFLDRQGLTYSRNIERNSRILTHVGTVKTTYCAPETMWSGVEALDQKKSCLLVDFKGLKGFSAGMIAGMLKKNWPGLRSLKVFFPGTEQADEVLAEQMAHSLVISQHVERLAQLIRPHLKSEQSIGLPAVLGLYQSQKVTAALSEMLGRPVFEISTMPPSIPGLRLKEAFEKGLREKRTFYFPQKTVLGAKKETDGKFNVRIGDSKSGDEAKVVSSKGVLLATGRFIGGGLSADRKNIKETIFNLPVHQPELRDRWHREDFLDPRGHPINRSGLEIDENFRPVDKTGRPAFEGLFAAGSILAHQDWKRTKCGVGLAISTAHAAVTAFMNKG
jgi:glycerol-3-phosphate dehydrogenase subunit B